MKTPFLARLLQSLQHAGQITTGSPLLLAVSGGVDSLVLLHALAALRAQVPLALHVATLDHGLRAEAADEVQFVLATAAHLGIPATPGAVAVPALAQAWRLNVEAAARRARYAFLARVAHDTGARQVATAHHADDQAETILLHVLRGSGSAGLVGLRPAAPFPDEPALTLLRPLLPFTRRQIEQYSQEQGLQPRHDASNSDTRLLRNRLRHEVLPLLTGINPNVSGALNRLGRVLAVEQDYMTQQFELSVLPHTTTDGQRWLLPRPLFQALHPALQQRFIRHAALALAQSLHLELELSHERVVAAVRVAQQGETGKRVQLGLGLQLRLRQHMVCIEQHLDAD
ncbi:MAG: tRNA lysidine(34) synthetase TilS [Anaerolineae bacterium]|nr:tRNA lysidine(34) synthetase TilS [Anaerolineae bacterium]